MLIATRHGQYQKQNNLSPTLLANEFSCTRNCADIVCASQKYQKQRFRTPTGTRLRGETKIADKCVILNAFEIGIGVQISRILGIGCCPSWGEQIHNYLSNDKP